MKTAKMKVEYIDHLGTDLTVVNAARVSFDKESQWETGFKMSDDDCDVHYGEPCRLEYTKLSDADTKLITYLAKHNHWSPFAHTSIQLRIKAPIFVARQLVKHQVGGVWNEVSRRYVDSEPEFYLPEVLRARAENVKQGSSNIPCVPKGKDGVCPNCGVFFVSNGNKQRYCSTSCQGEHYRKMPWGWRKTKWSRLKSSAERRGIEFSISEDDIEMPVQCPYIGVELDYTNDAVANNSPSVDRIRNDLGYIPGNVQTISSLANRMKGHATQDELIAFSKAALLRHGGIFVEPHAGILGTYQQSLDLYKSLLEQEVAPEQARMFLPQGAMTEWYWTGSLMFFARVCAQRLDIHAQAETSEVARQIADVVRPLFPVSWLALTAKEAV